MEIVAAQAGGADHEAAVAMSGTSMAAPHVTGALALVLSHRAKTDPANQYNAQQLRQALNRTARNRAGFHHEGYGYGVLDARALFDRLK
jgi:subtilisin family serine protease